MENLLPKISMLHVLLGFFLTLSGLGLIQEAKSLGINYGQVANNLPAPEKVLELLRSLKLSKARIYDTNPQVLTAFANSNVDLIVTVENDMLATLMDPNQALQWVYTHIKPFFPATKITGIAVGNEVFTGDDTTLISYLVPAMVSIHAALARLGLDQYIKVSTPNNLAVLQESYPPSAGTFRPELNRIMPQFLQFLAATKSPFWINAYPYFAYKDSPKKISLDYVLFNPNPGMIDPNTKLRYDNMLYAQVDAVVFAMARMGFGGLEVRVSETGWPSRGDGNEIGATIQNAAIYNHNILRRQLQNEGTPLRPNARLEIYVFALFNEDMKPGPTSERNYGLFQPDGTMAYNVGLSALSTATSSSSSSSSSSTSSASISLTSDAPQVINK
ncbi:Glycosyl hydrolase superfamily protein [Perilla frutescens var. hirtella]|uniref:glucan endo-1,3-beta-D-glucosidase n=1 Tax=Perilla frutescens var. hirtella TaxID=608512 RepID=A0AAD4P3K0_PERFH|nr:Glycosyl hydrolase superfamily protein [Perilla frutescens var. frutescens]KAH6793109.1 Glycosyl hydrolase superfamily protein [Perilla frutescens var. hirtella]KAH6825623.1 Glycosyl hydrolase superfamily protein [Perilla frutescens var. hirtella]